ncbi:MAG: hypothetical protein M5U19_05895 [Microthrixaceae bacterium]|nr:hypothetical protein [Microthrixaceae bacterium]
MPSRGMDPVMGRRTTESVEVGPNATITTFCVVHIGFGENAPTPPFVSALILPDGAAVSLYGTVLGIDHTQVRHRHAGAPRVRSRSPSAPPASRTSPTGSPSTSPMCPPIN